MWAHWRHLAYTIEPVFLSAHPNPQPKWQIHNPNGKSIGSAISAQLMAESPYILQWATLSPKLPGLMGDLDPPFNS